ncbi:MAG: substrate-binding domain-containing protein [Lachnospiraceae bacterium]|nr:substrate-binding domain-containing protein [Lachnospiraceae bacterium]
MSFLHGAKTENGSSGGRAQHGFWFLLLLAAFSAFVLCGCGGRENSEEVLVKPAGEEHPVSVVETGEQPEDGEEDRRTSVCLVVPSEDGPAASEIRILTEKAVEMHASMKVLNYMNDPIAQASAIEQAVREGASVIICDNMDETNTLRGIRRAKEKNIPVFLIGRGIDTLGMASAQILTESYTCVRKMGEEYTKEKKKGAAYVIMHTSGSEDDLAEAFTSVMTGKTGFQELESAVCDGQDADESYETAWELLHSHPNADTIVCVTTAQTEAAVAAAADLGQEPLILCLSADTDRIVQYVDEGKVCAAIVKPAEELAERAALSLEEYLKTGELPGTECYYIQGEIRWNGRVGES